jgi:hypothetical protein|tara:strand:+ start:77 stop:412 length:336 start_codon:yes stop_codon:yes gene_type:complete
MPTYVFKNKKTGVVYEDFMSISDMEKIISNPNMELVIDSVNIVSQQGDNIDAKTDAGWKETLAKISEAHPDSELTKQYGKRKSGKDVKTAAVRAKHKTIADRRIKRIQKLQ